MRKAIIVSVLFLLFVCAQAQVANYTNTTDNSDTTSTYQGPRFSLKQYYNGMTKKDSTMQIGYVLASGIILPGTAQVYNRDYWKLPIVYGGIGAMIYAGYSNNLKYQDTFDSKYRNYRNYLYIGAATLYWASLLDGMVSYQTDISPLPGRSTIYSMLLPGLGQAYNGDYWKIPIFVGGMGVCICILNYNNTRYQHYNNLYRTTNESQYKTLRDDSRRDRDYSFLATAVVYLLNVIDANVFSVMSDFDMSDDLSLNITPVVIEPLNRHFAYTGTGSSALGLQLSFKF